LIVGGELVCLVLFFWFVFVCFFLVFCVVFFFLHLKAGPLADPVSARHAGVCLKLTSWLAFSLTSGGCHAPFGFACRQSSGVWFIDYYCF